MGDYASALVGMGMGLLLDDRHNSNPGKKKAVFQANSGTAERHRSSRPNKQQNSTVVTRPDVLPTHTQRRPKQETRGFDCKTGGHAKPGDGGSGWRLVVVEKRITNSGNRKNAKKHETQIETKTNPRQQTGVFVRQRDENSTPLLHRLRF